jgi:hypothetical protein
MLSLTSSTVWHLLEIYYAHNAYYVAIITSSTLASYLWHRVGRGMDRLGVIDHALAGVWGAYDCIYAYIYCPTDVWLDVTMFTALVCLLNYLVIWLDFIGAVKYSMGHGLWQYLSAYKAVYIARALSVTHQVPQ